MCVWGVSVVCVCLWLSRCKVELQRRAHFQIVAISSHIYTITDLYMCVLVVYVCVCRPCAIKRKAFSLSLYVEYAQYLLFNEKFASSAEDRQIHHHYKSIESYLARMWVYSLCMTVCSLCMTVCSPVYECVFSVWMCIRLWWALLSIVFLDLVLLYTATAVVLLLFVGWLVVDIIIIIVVFVVVVELLVFVLFVPLETIIFIGHVYGPQKFGSLCFVEDFLNWYTILFTPVDRSINQSIFKRGNGKRGCIAYQATEIRGSR